MKKKDEIRELRGLNRDEVAERLKSVEEELMKLRFRHRSGQLPQSAQLGELRRRAARLKTIEREFADKA
jgi:large subunit ribosomal protein L29